MAKVIITMKIMPEDPSVNLDYLQNEIAKLVIEFKGINATFEKEPIGFGLVALMLKFALDESLGGTDKLEEKIQKIPGVQSTEVVMVSRALG